MSGILYCNAVGSRHSAVQPPLPFSAFFSLPDKSLSSSGQVFLSLLDGLPFSSEQAPFFFPAAFLSLPDKPLSSSVQPFFFFHTSLFPLPVKSPFFFRTGLPFSSGWSSSFSLPDSLPFLPDNSLSSSGQVSLSLQDGPFLPLPGWETSESDGPLLFEPHAASPNPSASFCHAALLSHLRTESPCSATGSNADRSCGDSSPAVRSPGISACRRGMPVPEYAHRRKDVASRVRAIPQCRDNRPPEPGP